METASDELITEAEKEHARKVLSDICAEVAVELSAAEAKTTARAVYHDAVTAAAKEIAAQIADESVPIAKEIVGKMLKDSSQQAFIEEQVTEACKPVARHGALNAIRRWSEERAMPKAELAARAVLSAQISNGVQPDLQTAVIASLRVLLENHLASNPQISAADREKLFADYLNGEAKKTAAEILSKEIGADLRRQAQSAAEKAIEEIASEATDLIARDEALNAARVVALDTAKMEISRLILAEAQRRAARLARERLQEESQKIEADKRAEYCQEEAKKIADQAVKAVTEEIADATEAELDLVKAHELALSAASAVAREFSGVYQLTCDEHVSPISKQTIVFLVAQIVLGVFIVWFFLLGGYEVCQPAMKAILPNSVYQAIYRSVPQHPERGANDKGTDIDDLLEEPSPEEPTGTTTGPGSELEPGKPDPGSTLPGSEAPAPTADPSSSKLDAPPPGN